MIKFQSSEHILIPTSKNSMEYIVGHSCSDEGIKLIEGASLWMDRGGVEPTKIEYHPNLSYLSYGAGTDRNQPAFHIA
jgi:hypothetical protein